MVHHLLIKKVERTATDTVTLHFDKLPHFNSYLPGQHVQLTASIAGEKVSRSYSICTSPYLDRHVALTIRHLPEGRLSGYLVKNARQGMEVTLEGPYGNFVTTPDPTRERHLLLYAAGSGITPLYSMLRSVLYQEPRSAVSLVYANHSADRVIFYEQLQELQQEFSNRLTTYHALSEPANFTGDDSSLIKGPLSRLLVRKLTQLLLAKHRQQASFYLCGPADFMQLIETTVVPLGIPASCIYKEYFTSIGNAPDAHSVLHTLPAREVIVAWQGEKHSVPVPSGTNVLQAALEQGLMLPHSCKEGLCGVCRASLVSGVVQMHRNSVLTADELAAGQVLLCQGYALGEGIEVQPLNV